MKGLMEFMDAALPWIALALLLAVFSVRSAGRRDGKEKREDYGSEGMALGMCLGAALALALHFSVGLGMMAGVLLGLAAGLAKEKSCKK